VDRADGTIEALAERIRGRRVVLFAGAGLSMALGLPSWRELIDHLCGCLGFDPGDIAGPDDYRALAEYYRIRQGDVGSLRKWMDQKWGQSCERVRHSRIHEIIVQLDFPTIYTTNYDRNIEAAFGAHGKKYVKIANAGDLAKAREGATQIVKFHGDFDDLDSLVFAETDYFDRLRFDSPLDIKFRADAFGKTVLFVGYSMSDMNIRLLLHWLWRTWEESGYGRHRPQSFLYMARENEMQAAVLEQWGVTAVRSDVGDPEQGLTRFLERLLTAVNQQKAATRSSRPRRPARAGQ
jgi:hypothetical protein